MIAGILGMMSNSKVPIQALITFNSAPIEDVFKTHGSEAETLRALITISLLKPWLARVDENEAAEIGC
jgi:hypothetical protein